MQNITIHHFFVLCLYDCPEWIKFWAVFALLSPPCQGGNGCGARIVQLEKCLPSITRDDEDVDKNHVDDIDDDGVNDDEGDGDVMWIWGLHSTGWVVVPLIKHSTSDFKWWNCSSGDGEKWQNQLQGFAYKCYPFCPDRSLSHPL